jgi:hypothetical protein
MSRPPDLGRSPATRQRGETTSQASTFHNPELIHAHKDGQALAAQIRKVRSLWFLSVEAARAVASVAFGGAAR